MWGKGREATLDLGALGNNPPVPPQEGYRELDSGQENLCLGLCAAAISEEGWGGLGQGLQIEVVSLSQG